MQKEKNILKTDPGLVADIHYFMRSSLPQSVHYQKIWFQVLLVFSPLFHPVAPVCVRVTSSTVSHPPVPASTSHWTREKRYQVYILPASTHPWIEFDTFLIKKGNERKKNYLCINLLKNSSKDNYDWEFSDSVYTTWKKLNWQRKFPNCCLKNAFHFRMRLDHIMK